MIEIISQVAEAFASAVMIGVLILSALVVAVLLARLMTDAFDSSV